MKKYFAVTVIICFIVTSCYEPIVYKAQVKFQSLEQDFGKINAGDTINKTFEFQNIGNDTLFIVQVQPSCECTIADYTKAPILPGNQGFISIKYGSNRRFDIGRQIKTVIVQTNSDTLLTVFRVTGLVENDSLKNVMRHQEKI